MAHYLNSDFLTPYFFCSDLLSGRYPMSGWTLSASPYFVPDHLVLSGLLVGFGRTGLAYALFTLVFYPVLFVLAGGCVKTVVGRAAPAFLASLLFGSGLLGVAGCCQGTRGASGGSARQHATEGFCCSAAPTCGRWRRACAAGASAGCRPVCFAWVSPGCCPTVCFFFRCCCLPASPFSSAGDDTRILYVGCGGRGRAGWRRCSARSSSNRSASWRIGFTSAGSSGSPPPRQTSGTRLGSSSPTCRNCCTIIGGSRFSYWQPWGWCFARCAGDHS